MEEQLAELATKVAELEGLQAAGNTALAELYYYLTIPLMVIIHAGFLAYEMGASRQKNVLASGIKNILAFAFVIPAYYFIGWWIYWAFPTGFTGSTGGWEISGFEYAAFALPWSEYAGPNLSDQSTGVFWGAFTLFAATTASIFSGA
ncbi:MAG: ammonium transporter, partial [Pseudomonadota bacterium]